MKHNIKCGLYTALITPFWNGVVDFASLEKLLEFQIKARVDGIVLCGTTGESATLSDEERYQMVKFTSSFCRGKTRIIAGTGTNNTHHSMELTRRISELDIDGFLVVSPYYNKTNDEGLVLHFKKIAESTHLPILLYNVPSRTGLDIPDSIIFRLSDIPNIIGLKDATGNLARVVSVRSELSEEFLLFSGEDSTSLAFNASGGNGVISVVSNIAPQKMLKLQEISLSRNNLSAAFSLQKDIFHIANALFRETNPIPVKYACFLMNMCHNEYRLPLFEPSETVKEQIKQILEIC